MADGPDTFTAEQTVSRETHVPDFKPLTIADDAVARFNSEGKRGQPGYEFLEVIDSSREALAHLPPGKQGIVLGSGQNSELWKSRGWKTLDIGPGAQADYTHNVNQMEEIIPPNSQDFLFAENIRMDRGGNEGAGWGRLAQQANLALKEGGVLIIQTGSIEDNPRAGLPPRQEYAKILASHGFKTSVVLSKINPKPTIHQSVWYYAQKISSGYDASRASFT